jgi:hypothetical protein
MSVARRLLPGLLPALLVLCVSVPTAGAAATRAEYVAQVDPICETGQRDMRAEAKRQNPAIKKISRTLQQQRDNLTRERENALLGKLAAKEFKPTLEVFPRVTTQISAVVPAPGDEAAVASWLAARRSYSQHISRAVRAAKRGKTQTYNRFIEEGTAKLIEGEIPVETFGFRFCLLSSPQD